MPNVNRQWLLASHPEGMPEESNWKLVESPLPEPGPGEMLARTIWLSVDPYMRGRISRARNYAKGVEIGERMQGGGVGEIVRSNNPDFAPGTIVESRAFGSSEERRVGHAWVSTCSSRCPPVR